MPSAPSIELKRHYRELSAKEMDGVVDVVADLIVNFLKTRSGHVVLDHGTQAGREEVGRKAPQSTWNKP